MATKRMDDNNITYGKNNLASTEVKTDYQCPNTSIPLELRVSLPPLIPNEIYLGDSFELCERVPAKTVDLILEDMPYNTTACEWDVKIDLKLYWETRLRLLKPTGVVVLTSKQPFTSELLHSNAMMFKYEMIWYKDRSTGFLNAKKMPLPNHENILVFYNNQIKYNPQRYRGRKSHSMGTAAGTKSKTNVYGNFVRNENTDNLKYPKTVLEFNQPFPQQHNTQKPVGLFEYLIRTYTNEGDLVFDGFGGSGTTAVAAHKSKRNFIVIEKEKKYCDLAVRRLDSERAQLNIF